MGRAEGMTDDAKRDQLFYKMRMIPSLKERMIRDYDNKPPALQTSRALLDILRDQVDDMKEMRTYNETYALRPHQPRQPQEPLGADTLMHGT